MSKAETELKEEYRTLVKLQHEIKEEVKFTLVLCSFGFGVGDVGHHASSLPPPRPLSHPAPCASLARFCRDRTHLEVEPAGGGEPTCWVGDWSVVDSAVEQDSVDKFNTTMGKGFWTTIEMWQVCALACVCVCVCVCVEVWS